MATRRKKDQTKPWKDFEKAVNAFLQTLLKQDTNATVRFDPPKIDRDTGKKQQVDVWIEYKIGGHLPITMLVSCKNHGRKLDIGEIRTFIQEIEDSRASCGAIYSREGFTRGAISKAYARGIGCFQLWRDRPADQPAIQINRRYWCCDSINVPVVTPGDSGLAPKTWDELFDLPIIVGGSEHPLGVYLEAALLKCKSSAVKNIKHSGLVFPNDFTCCLDLEDSASRSTKIFVECRWKRFRGKLSASLLNGSYCESTGQFTGTESAAYPMTYPPPPARLGRTIRKPTVMRRPTDDSVDTQ